jgi:hypothetical protein
MPNVEYIKNRLLAERTRSEEGKWEIWGEDNNLDMGGSRDIPLLATVSGTYEEAVLYALTLPRFFAWGGGGDIKKVKDVKVIDLKHLNSKEGQRLQKRMVELEEVKKKADEEIAAIRKQLGLE